MKVEVLKTFQLSGTPPHLCGEKFTIAKELGEKLIHKGLVTEIKVKPRKTRKRRKRNVG